MLAQQPHPATPVARHLSKQPNDRAARVIRNPQRGHEHALHAGSIDAMREYSQAQDLQNGGKADEALAHYMRAIELDPKFGRAYSGAANINFRRGNQAEADALFKQALSLINRMTDREKHRTLGSYYVQVAGNCEKGVEEYSALVKAYPADSAGYSPKSCGR